MIGPPPHVVGGVYFGLQAALLVRYEVSDSMDARCLGNNERLNPNRGNFFFLLKRRPLPDTKQGR